MKDTILFEQALGLGGPWFVKDCVFNAEEKRLEILIDFHKGGEFACPQCGAEGCKAYDVSEKTWRHLNFFEHETYLRAWTPRVRCSDCGIKTAGVPWARGGTGFTALFEAFIMALAREMPVKALARLVGENDTRVWRIIEHHVKEAREKEDGSGVTAVGVDETSSKRGHNYVSLFVDLERSKLLFGTEGKDARTVAAFREDLERRGGKAENVEKACCDMSPAFASGLEENFPRAEITYDKFHVMKLLSKAVDEVRREEQRERPELKRSRYLFLKNPENLTLEQTARLGALTVKEMNLKTARAWRIKLNFQEMYLQPTLAKAEAFLKEWHFWATHSRLPRMVEAARMVKRHWKGILQWIDSRISNGVLEGINSLVQAAKAKARGYRTSENLIAIAYLVAGKLSIATHTK